MNVRGVLAALGCLAVMNAYGHGGGLNAEGCHNDRKHGGYHCHPAPAVTSRTTSTDPAAPSGAAKRVPLATVPPTCHVGPRGGGTRSPRVDARTTKAADFHYLYSLLERMRPVRKIGERRDSLWSHTGRSRPGPLTQQMALRRTQARRLSRRRQRLCDEAIAHSFLLELISNGEW
jgi:hypothetical protein